MGNERRSVAERFEQRVDRSGECHLWRGGKCRGGYGVATLPDGRQTSAHRVAWILANGPVPRHIDVCHKCDVRLCVRLDHLFLGTRRANILDMHAKGRAAVGAALNHPPQRGELNHAAKLSDRHVARMRAVFAAGGYSQRAIARMFKTSYQNAHLILKCKSRKPLATSQPG